MTPTKHLILAGAVIALLILGATAVGAVLLYDTAFQQQRRQLLSNVRSHGALIQSVARFDVEHSPDYPAPFPDVAEGGTAATLDQVREAFGHTGGPGHTGELVLGARRNGDLTILLHERRHEHPQPHPLKQHVVGEGRAEPMRRALRGETGTMVGKDYEGKTVLAAYHPVPEVGWGLVAKRDLAALRAPYIRDFLLAGPLGLALVGIGGLLFHRATRPVLQRLRRSESHWQRLFQAAGEGIVTTDLEGRIQMANPQARHLFRLAPEDPVEGRPLFDFLPPETHDAFRERLRARPEGGGETYEGTVDVGETERTLRFNPTPYRGPGGTSGGSLTLIEDVTEQRRAEAEQRILSDAVHQTADAVFLMDPEGRIEYANPAFQRITGYDLDTVRGHRPEALLDAGRMPEGYYERMWASVANGEVFRDVVPNRARDGQLFHWEKTLSPILGKDGSVTRVVGTATDLSEREALQEKLHHASHYDALTELPNRLSLMERLETVLARIQWSECLTAVALLDIDNFALINDTFGHDVGDQILKALGERLSAHIREGDMVARTGDDTFGIILDQIAAREDVPTVIEALWVDLSRPFQVAGEEVSLALSMGVALAPEDATDPQDLYHHAESALAQAKRFPEQGYRFYAEELGQWARRRLVIEQGLRRALDEDAFELHFQPQIDLTDGRIRGLAALLRWSHPELGPISPAEFIPVAEQSQLILPIGERVLDQTLDQVAQWRAAGLDPGVISINLSTVQLAASDLATKVKKVLERTGEAPGSLELEVTETAFMTHIETAKPQLTTLSETGVRLAIDDFGTGYSSLAYLSQLPLNTLKIDRSFVGQLDSLEENASIVLSVLSLAHSLDLKVVAEGVETEDQLAFLQRHGCDAVQGFLLSYPLPADEVPGLLQTGRWLEPLG